jgi:hypothetical protein
MILVEMCEREKEGLVLLALLSTTSLNQVVITTTTT